MNTATIFSAMLLASPALFGVELIPAKSAAPAPSRAAKSAQPPRIAAAPGAIYVVTRATTTESRALLSARLVKLRAANIHWYDNANVVRADFPAATAKETLAALRADPDVILALPQTETVTPQLCSTKATNEPAPQQDMPTPALPPTGAVGPPPPNALLPVPAALMPMPPPMQMPMGMGMGVSGPMGLMDSIAGGVVNKMLNRTPSCKISLSRPSIATEAAGGDEVVDVRASGSCAWQAQPSVPWIHINSGSGVSGSGVLSYTVEPSNGKKRVGSIAIIGALGGSPLKGKATVVVTQPSR